MQAPRKARDDDSAAHDLAANVAPGYRTIGRCARVCRRTRHLLLEIAEERPTTIPALRRVKGMGPSRLARYGEEMIEIIKGAVSD
jgi:superfamily II DNA helicase RecQ